uniref:Zinc finger PHD-type domain-containing protein n=1 Tax=Glossina austeni TaxID=7395 RepID=A0A1A9VHS7_GLOAU
MVIGMLQECCRRRQCVQRAISLLLAESTLWLLVSKAPSEKGSKYASCKNLIGFHGAVGCEMCVTWQHAACIGLSSDDVHRSEAVIALKSELKPNTKIMNVRVESYEQRVGQIKDYLESRLVAMNVEINVLCRMINRSNFIIRGLFEGLKDMPGTVIKIAERYSVTIPLHDISFVGYMKNNKTIMVKLNLIGMWDVLIGKYFKKIKIRPTYASNCVDDPKFEGEIPQRRIYLYDHLCTVSGELNKTCANLRKNGKITRFRIVNTIKPYAVLVVCDGSTTKLDLQGCEEILGTTSMTNAG